MTRREFVAATVAAASIRCGVFDAGSEPTGQDLLDRIGAQLYTVRELIAEKPRETLERIATIGYREVEVRAANYAKLAPMFEEFGLNALSYRIETPVINGHWEMWDEMMSRFSGRQLERTTLEETIEAAADAEFKYLAVSYLLPPERDSVDRCKASAEQFNRAGELCAAAGLKLCYHNHAFEFGELEETTAFEVLMAEFDPALVGLQLDVFWASVGGRDPVEIFKRFPGRIPTVHLKDKAVGAPEQHEEFSISPEAFVSIGRGELDFAAILEAGEIAGVDRYYVEQDQSPDPMRDLWRSREFLSRVVSQGQLRVRDKL